MKLLIKILVSVVVFIVVLVFAGYIFLNVQGKNMVKQQLSGVFSKPVSVKDVKVNFPLTIRIEELEIQGFLLTDLSINVNPLGLLAGKVVLNKLVISKPNLNLIRFQDGSLNLPLKENKGGNQVVPIILNFDLIGGKVHYVDNYKNFSGYAIDISEIDIKIRKKGLGFNPAFNFDISAQIGDKTAAGKNIRSSGWIDLAKKNMDGNIEMKDLNSAYIMPLYQKILGDSVSQAMMNLNAKLTAKDNNLKCECNLQLSGLKSQPQEPGQEEVKKSRDITAISNIFDIFSSPEGKLELDFIIYTKLDHPGFERIDFGPNMFKAATKNLISNPEETVSKVKEIGKDIKEWGKQKGKDILGGGEIKDEDIQGIINIFKK